MQFGAPSGAMKSSVVAALLLASALVGVQPAWAHGGGAGGEQLPKDVPAVTPDGEKAKADLDAIAGDAAKKKVADTAVTKGKLALGRAHGASLGGDTEGARLLSRVALAWAGAAKAAVRAAETERAADAGETRVVELREKLVRAKALLIENEARKLQLTVEVEKAEQAAKALPRGAAKSTDKPGANKPKPELAKPEAAKPKANAPEKGGDKGGGGPKPTGGNGDGAGTKKKVQP